MKLRILAAAAAAFTVVATAPVRAQAPLEPGSGLTISVITMGPGTAVWERFGHNAIRVTDAATGADTTYNYGMFDFGAERFFISFAQGRPPYWTEGHRADREIGAYIRADRSVWSQELDLTPAQKVALRDFLEWNSREENKYYGYDYFLDNCSTRVRDAIDRVLGGLIEAQTTDVPTGTTWRSHTRRLTAADPVAYTGLNIGLGPATDRPISAWEEMFLPLALRDHLRSIQVPAPGGGTRPLVRSEAIEYVSSAPEPPAEPPVWWPRYLGAGAVIGALLLLLGERSRSSGAARFGFRIIGIGWSVVAGLAGVALAYLWAFTDHSAAYANQNLFQLSPLSLLIAPLLPGLGTRGGPGRWTVRLAIAVALLALGGLLWKALPLVQQVNGEIIALALPIQAALGLSVWRAWRRAGQRDTGDPVPGPQSSPG